MCLRGVAARQYSEEISELGDRCRAEHYAIVMLLLGRGRVDTGHRRQARRIENLYRGALSLRPKAARSRPARQPALRGLSGDDRLQVGAEQLVDSLTKLLLAL